MNLFKTLNAALKRNGLKCFSFYLSNLDASKFIGRSHPGKFYDGDLYVKSLMIVSMIGISLLAVTYFLSYTVKFYNYLFWASNILISIPIFLLIVNKSTNENYRILNLIVFAVMIYALRTLPSTLHFHFGDELLHLDAINLICASKNLDISPYFEIIKYYPLLELFVLFGKYLTNLEIFPVAKIFIGCLHVFFLIFIYLFFKRISSSELFASIGAFIYATNPLYIFFHSLFSYESLGIFYVIIAIYLVSEISFKKYRINLRVLLLILMIALAFSHPLSSIMLLLFMVILTSLWIYNDKLISFGASHYLTTTILFAVISLGWLIYISNVVLIYLAGNFIDRISKILELSLIIGEKISLSSNSLANSLLPVYEYVVDSYLYVPSLLILCSVGIYHIYKNNSFNLFLYSLVIYGPLLYLFSLGLIPTSGSELAQRFWGFSYIGISLIISFGFNELTRAKDKSSINGLFKKIFGFFIIAIVILGGISIGDKPIHREPDLLSPKLTSGAGSITTDAFYAASWFENNCGNGKKLLGSGGSSSVFISYGSQKVDTWNAWKIFLPKKADNTTYNLIKSYDYLIVDNRISKSLPELGYYFSPVEMQISYDRTRPLPRECLDKFDQLDILSSTYNNGNIKIYGAKREFS